MTPLPTALPPPYPDFASFRKWSAADYHKMADMGLILEGDPYELIEGYVVEKPMKGDLHESSMRRLTIRLPRRLPGGYVHQIQGAVALGESEPEPDVAVLRGDETTCDGRLPAAADVAVVIEVSDSSLGYDRLHKSRVYARAGIPVYWIVNLVDGQVEVYSDPDPAANPPAYRTRTDYRPGQDVPITLDGQVVGAIPAADLIP
ncbi:MAG: Uma2 family endonuclease [Gemmataceae bacterium]|nr:Uma2 family endonuclease [Gemmataceae bacterium]